MAFVLNKVVPWGRTLDEYKRMFMLGDDEGRIAGFGDGPASFNFEATIKGLSVTSFDPIYSASAEQIQKRINEVRNEVMQQMSANIENYVWNDIKSIDELEKRRMSAMQLFLNDFEKGRKEGRYIPHSLPDKLDVKDNSFELGLSSHFLLMYTSLGYEFHIAAIEEMLRVCTEVRIFPILDLDAKQTELINKVINYFDKKYKTQICKTDYEFQKNGNKMLKIF